MTAPARPANAATAATTTAFIARWSAASGSERANYQLFVTASIAPDNMLIAIALPDTASLGVLSSRVHTR